MRTIWKFPFEVDDVVGIPMPAGAEIIHVDTQGGRPCLWAIVDPEAPKVVRNVLVCGTGHPIPDEGFAPLRHLGTFPQRQFEWHVFDGGE